MSRSVAFVGTLRALAALMVALFLLAGFAPAALAVEEGEAPAAEDHGPAPDISQIGTQNEVSRQYLPEPAEPPPFMRFLYWPLAIAGVVIALVMLLMYLAWQPKFAEERRSKRRR